MRSIRRAAFFLILLACAAAAPAESFADSQTFNAIFFRPATGRNTYLMLYDTETLKQLQFDAGMYFSYGYDPLDVRFGTNPKQKVISNLMVADFVASLGAFDFLQFGVDLPIILVNQLVDPFATGSTRQNYADLGDMRLEAKYRVLDPCRKYIGLAFVPFITFPTGKSAHFVGAPGITGGLMAVLDGRIHPRFGMTLNLGYQGGKKTTASNVELQHQFLIGLGAEGNFNHGVDVFAELNAQGDLSNLFGDVDRNPTEVMIGSRWDIKQTGVSLHAGFGTCLVCGVRGARFRAVLGTKYRLMTPKYKAKESQAGPLCNAAYAGFTKSQLYRLAKDCPANPEDWRQGVHDDACPKYYELKELASLVLRCPSKPEQFDPRYHDQACQKVFDMSQLYSPEEIRSIVALGLAEMSLVCPDDPSDFNAQVHDQACPKYYDLEQTRTLARICPSPSNFRMGVDDPSCPKYYTLRETYGDVDWGEVDRLAGIEGARYRGISGGEIQTLNPVYFDFNRTELKSEAIAGIDEAMRVINATPWISVVRVAGHADAIGTAAANEEISMDRCRAVINYMRSHGLRSDVEMVPVAYGSYRPAATNDTERGRMLNRRVVFMIRSVKYRGAAPAATRAAAPAYVEPAPVPAAYTPPASGPVYQPTFEPAPTPAPTPAPVPEPAPAPQYQPQPSYTPPATSGPVYQPTFEPAPAQPVPAPQPAPVPQAAQPAPQPTYQPQPAGQPVITVPPAAPEGTTGDVSPLEPVQRWGQ